MAGHGDDPQKKQRGEFDAPRVNPGEWRGNCAEHERAEDLAENQDGVRRITKLARRYHRQCVEHAAGERDQGGQREGGGRWPERDQHSDEPGPDGENSRKVEFFPEQEYRESRDVNRRREVIGHHVGERKVCHCPIKGSALEGGKDDPAGMKAGPRRNRESHALPAHDRQKDRKRRDAAQQQHLPNRIGCDKPLSHYVVHGEKKDAQSIRPMPKRAPDRTC